MKRSVVAAAIIVAAGVATSCAAPAAPMPEAWAFCGIHPDARHAARQVQVLADAGISSSFGPCLPPDWSSYTPAEPGVRYMGAEGYLRALLLNASVGMQTVVYDAAIWSDDAVVRAAAIEFWRPHLAHIRAWDMGDEFDPNTPEWDVLVARWRIVIDHVEPVTGVGPYTNNLPGHDVADAALAAMPEQARHFSFNDYTEGPMGEPVDVFAMVDHLGMRVGHLMCAVNALTHFQYVVTPAELELQTTMALDAGCDSILVFGGGQPYDTPGFDHASFVGRDGTSTPLASALHRALTKKY